MFFILLVQTKTTTFSCSLWFQRKEVCLKLELSSWELNTNFKKPSYYVFNMLVFTEVKGNFKHNNKFLYFC